MKPMGRSLPVLAVALLTALLSACPNPNISDKGASLTISITNAINARTLLPPIDMNAASFTVNGTGPGGASFSQTTSGGPVTVTGLAFGSWSVTVNALNSAGTIIGSGQATVTVHTGQTTAVAISVVPLAGNGTLDISVTWTTSQVEFPSIQASLMPPSGTATPLSFSLTGNQATFSSTTIPAGYQTLTVQLLDNGIPVMGAVEVVRIVAGQTTTGSYAFTNVNQPGGSVQVNITPAMADPIPVSIGGVGAVIAAGTSMTAIASVSDGTTGIVYVWYLNGVSQATGSSSYAFGNALAAGYYRLDVTAYTADGTRAGSATASFQVMNSSAGRYLYVLNYGSDTVSAYAIGRGGQLTPLSTPTFASGNLPEGIAITPNGSFLYVANFGAGTVSGYAIGSDGLLAPLGTPVFATGGLPWGISTTPNGAFLYVANNGGNTVSGFSVGPNGLLTPLSTPTVAAESNPYGVAVTPDGSYLYATNSASNTVSAYSIGPDGLLTPLSIPSFATGATPMGIAVTPNGAFLYVANWGSNSVSGYAVGPGGLLTPLSTPSFASGNSPARIAITHNGAFLYVSNFGAGTVSGYAVGPDGLLSPLSPPTFAAGSTTVGMAIAPNSAFLYAATNGNNSVSAYAIGTDGLLSPLNPATYMAGGNPNEVVIVP